MAPGQGGADADAAGPDPDGRVCKSGLTGEGRRSHVVGAHETRKHPFKRPCVPHAAPFRCWAARRSSEVHMPSSKRIGGIVGPTIVAMVASEFPLVQPHLYDAQIPPAV